MGRVRWAAGAALLVLAIGGAWAISAVVAAAGSVPEWYKGGAPLGATTKVTFKISGGPAVLEGNGGAGTITCTAESGTGTAEGPTGIKSVKLTYTGCSKGAVKCNTKEEAAGTVKTNTLEGKPVYLNTNHTVAGLELKPASTSLFATISCGSEFSTEVLGELLGEAAPLREGAKEEALTGTLTLAQEGGVPKWDKVEESGAEIILTAWGSVASAVGGGTKMSERDVETITFKEALELHKS